ncbi:hypothetical protein [Alteriqipengyuania lutimaris]|uniref:Uncharacterized protein n=1 Tax=Alteriqipengyuania lutimaris TaxID=1538146 RepID=A0A395LMA9_9SPHN|nr:hypothetical protein [Alteriqipengyuania lutimaris]MBB3033456.1 hypothetical protein [Alteriqipengyuania lutimaris]RDS77527.1 hypothetical protein DL238_07855 [Alteriqipengyuania lutimaris]
MTNALDTLAASLRNAALACLLGAAAGPALAQEPDGGKAAPGYLERLSECRQIADSGQRLACYDREVGAVVAASEQGDVRIVDREDVRQTKRRLFGFSIPDNLFGGRDDDDDEKMDTLQTTITQVRTSGRRGFLITTAEGSVWRITSAPMRLAPPKAGQSVEFKTASLGSYFIRINGQLGVKGVRVE